MQNNVKQENKDPVVQVDDVKDHTTNTSAMMHHQLTNIEHTIENRNQLVLLINVERSESSKLLGSGQVNNIDNAKLDMLNNKASNQSKTYPQSSMSAKIDGKKPCPQRKDTAVFGLNDQTKQEQSETEQLQDNKYSDLFGQEQINCNQEHILINKQPENLFQDKRAHLNQISSSFLHRKESLECSEHLEQLNASQIQLNQLKEAKIQSQENESQMNLQISKGAKNQVAIEKQFQRPESPFVKAGVNITISPNLLKAQLESLNTLTQQGDTKTNLGAVAVASPAPNYNGFNNQTQLSADAIFAKQLNYQTKSPEMSSLQFPSRQFSFYQKSLSPHANKSVLDSHRSDRIMENHQFNSPEKTNKSIYNVENDSGIKINGLMESPFQNENVSHLIHHDLLSQKKQRCSPIKNNTLFKGFITAPHIISSKQKGRFNSPCNDKNKVINEANISENDARFSSNTTERYQTRCSKTCVIHSNFKFNQNSLQKQKSKAIKQSEINIIQNQKLTLQKQISFAPDRDTTNSPAFANPLIDSTIINQQTNNSNSKLSVHTTPLFGHQTPPSSIFNQFLFQPHPSVLRVGGQIITAKKVKEEQFSSQKKQSLDSSGSGSSETFSDNSNSVCSDQSSKTKMHLFNMSQQSQTYKFDHGLFTQDVAIGLGNQDQIVYNRCANMPGFYQMHPALQQAIFQYHIIQQHQQHQHNHHQQFNFMSQQELAHHHYHSTMSNHVPGCTLKCSCGLLNVTADQFFYPKDKMTAGRSRDNSNTSSPQKSCYKNPNMFHCHQFNPTLKNFSQSPKLSAIYPFANMSAMMNPSMSDPANGGGIKPFINKDSQQKKQNTGQRNAPNEDSNNIQTEDKRQKTSQESEKINQTYQFQSQVLKTPENKQMKGSVRKRDHKSNQKIQINLINLGHENIDYDQWSSQHQQKHVLTENQIFVGPNSKSKKSKISRTQTKKERDQFDAPDAIYPSRDFEGEAPYNNSDFKTVNEKGGRKKSQNNTQLKTMDTHNRNSTIKGNQFNYEISPATSKYENKFNSNIKETTLNNLFNNEIKQLHLANHQENKLRSENADSVRNNSLSNKRGGQKYNQMSVSKISIQEKEQNNQKNEEEIRDIAEKILAQTMTQEQLFKKISEQEPRVQQCMGCKCKSTKCLKLYCECLRNNATCGPACSCNEPKFNRICNNNDQFKEQRIIAIKDILQRNRKAFDSKVYQDKHFKGCRCKQSFCQKRYCECFERKVPCTDKCKCENCKNVGPCDIHNDSASNQLTAQNDQESMIIREQFNDQANERSESIQEQQDLQANNQIVSGYNMKEMPNNFQQRHFDPDQELFQNDSTQNQITGFKENAPLKVKDQQSQQENIPDVVQVVNQGKDENGNNKDAGHAKQIVYTNTDFIIPPQEVTIHIEDQNMATGVKKLTFEALKDKTSNEKQPSQVFNVPQKTSFNMTSQSIEKQNPADADIKEIRQIARKEKESLQINASNQGPSKKNDISFKFAPQPETLSIARASKRIYKNDKIDNSVVKKNSTSSNRHQIDKTKIQDQPALTLNITRPSVKFVLKDVKDSVSKKQTLKNQIKRQTSATSAQPSSNQQKSDQMNTRKSKRILNQQQLKHHAALIQYQEADENDNPNSGQTC